MDHFDPYNVFLATNIPQRLKTGFVVQGHMYHISNTKTVHILILETGLLKA